MESTPLTGVTDSIFSLFGFNSQKDNSVHLDVSFFLFLNLYLFLSYQRFSLYLFHPLLLEMETVFFSVGPSFFSSLHFHLFSIFYPSYLLSVYLPFNAILQHLKIKQSHACFFKLYHFEPLKLLIASCLCRPHRTSWRLWRIWT